MTIAVALNHPIDCGVATTSTFSRQHAKQTIADRRFDLAAAESKRITSPGSSSTVTVKDAIYQRNTSAGYVTDFALSLNVRQPGFGQTISFSSSDTGVLAPSETVLGQFATAVYQGGGTCVIRATANDGESSLLQLTASSVQPATVDTFTAWATSSLAKHCESQIDSRLGGSLDVYTSQDLVSGSSFTRNASFWAAGIDLTCVSPWNSGGKQLYAGTLISPRHVLFCEHFDFHPAVNDAIKFVDASNVVRTYTVTGLQTISDYSGAPNFSGDITIGVLNQDVHAGITFARVLPSAWRDYLPTIAQFSRVPVLCFNQQERATVAEFGLAQTGRFGLYAATGQRQSYFQSLTVGDSGNPAFLVVNSTPVVLGTFTFGGAGGGSSVADFTSSVNTALTTLGGGYQLTAVDLSSFPTY